MGRAQKTRTNKLSDRPVYTRGGDSGETYCPALGRVPKTAPRVIANGAVDELNCVLGELIARLERSGLGGPRLRTPLRRLKRRQRELFVVGSLVSGAVASTARTRAQQKANVGRLEREIDAMEKDLAPLQNFILPGGGALAAAGHLARAVCRRAERDCVAALADPAFPREVVPYLNRLADWLFVLARWLAQAAGPGDEYWHQPSE